MAVIYWQVDWIEFSWVLLLRNKHKRKKDSHEGMPLQLSNQLIQMRFQNWAFTFWYMQLCDAMMLPFNLLFSAPFQNCQNVEKGFSMLPQISIWHHKIAYTGLWKVTVMWYLYKLPHFVRVGFRHNTELREENKYMTFRRDNPRIRYAIIRLSSIITSCLGLVRAQFYSHKRWTKELMTKKKTR